MTDPSQIVYLSNRPEVLAQTLAYTRHFMPWLSEYVVLTPSSAVDAVHRAIGDADIPGLTVIGESSLLAAGETVPSSHAARNAFLRRILAERGPVDDVFIQSDDDYRPLKDLQRNTFVEDGRVVSYTFYDLALWRRTTSPFDQVQNASYLLLSYLGADHLCYASHMPQCIDKAHLLEAFRQAERISGSVAFCEWSLPLNFGRFVEPGRYAEPRTFRTMGWPQYPHEWPYWRRPDNLAFENFYPELYRDGHLFGGLSAALDVAAPERQAFEKISRWYAFDLAAGVLDFPPGVANPWQSSRGRRVFFAMAGRARKFYEYVTLAERTQLRELAGAVDRLQRAVDQPKEPS